MLAEELLLHERANKAGVFGRVQPVDFGVTQLELKGLFPGITVQIVLAVLVLDVDVVDANLELGEVAIPVLFPTFLD